MKQNRFCEQCGKKLTNERRICADCKKLNKRIYAKKHYAVNKQIGRLPKRYGTTKCVLCGKEIIKNRRNQEICYECFIKHHHKSVDDYNKVKRSKNSNTLARQMMLDLGLCLNSHLHVHHIDENPDNNSLENFLILSDRNHAKLHRFLEKNWSLLLKDKSSNLENCWNTLRGQLTTTWLETMNVKVLKITEIGQSAAEPLNNDYIYRFA